MLEIPVSYQGGKSRIAGKIIDIIFPSLDPICPIEDTIFFDFCCGSGAISIELINRGFDPSNIHMLDKGPWGIFWQDIGEGTFDLNKLYCLCQNVPKNKADIKTYMEHLSKQEANIDTPYVYLLLQASSFGGKAIWIEDNHWQNCSFRY
jgi:site-specific DNA-adenine methylase